MEKLTLEHIAPHFTNCLMVQVQSVDGIEILPVTAIQRKDGTDIIQVRNTDYYPDSDDNEFTIKPILHPMSDLTKPILNGIIPAIEIANFFDEGHNQSDSPVEMNLGVIIVGDGKCDNVSDVRIYLSKNTINSVKMHGNEAPFQISRHITKWLYANKFDVDGLIEKGLAIDVNTLETNPYTQ